MALKKKKKLAKKKAVKRKSAPKKKTAAKKRPAKKKSALKKKKPVAKKAAKKSEGNLIGEVTHYFPHVQAAVIKLKGPLSIGETLKIKGHTTDFNQTVTSLQIDRVNISSAKKGDEIGVQVNSRTRQGDKVYKI